MTVTNVEKTITRADSNTSAQADVRDLLDERLGIPLADDEFGFLLLQGAFAEIDSVWADARKREAAVAKAVDTMRNLRAAQGREVGETPSKVGGMITDDGDRRFALSRLLALEAERSPEVMSFREKHLGGGERTLDWEKIGEWIKGEAEAQGAQSQYVEIVLPEGTTLRPTLAGLVAEDSTPLSELAIEGGVSARFVRYGLPGGTYVRRVAVKAGGVLDELRTLSQRLAKAYSWTEDQATVFVLSGVTPLMAGIRQETRVQTEHPAASRVTFVIDPLVAPQTVLATYSELRQKILEGNYRPLGEKHLKLAVFAAERRPPAKWADVMEAWNAENEGQKYVKVTVFARDCTAAQRRLLEPRLNPDALL
jgi:hypothetical protein